MSFALDPGMKAGLAALVFIASYAQANELRSACVKNRRDSLTYASDVKAREQEIAQLEKLLEAKRRELDQANARLEFSTTSAEENCNGKFLKRE